MWHDYITDKINCECISASRCLMETTALRYSQFPLWHPEVSSRDPNTHQFIRAGSKISNRVHTLSSVYLWLTVWSFSSQFASVLLHPLWSNVIPRFKQLQDDSLTKPSRFPALSWICVCLLVVRATDALRNQLKPAMMLSKLTRHVLIHWVSESLSGQKGSVEEWGHVVVDWQTTCDRLASSAASTGVQEDDVQVCPSNTQKQHRRRDKDGVVDEWETNEAK